MFVFRAMFWIAAVALLAPADRHGSESASAPRVMLQFFRTAALAELKRVKAELGSDARADLRGDSV